MRKLSLAAVTLAALALVGGAGAGGWATVGVSPLPSEDSTTWTPTLTVLQHGRTPLDGVEPTITIRNEETGATRTFTAAPTGQAGQYEARVVFPAAGVWTYTIDDDFSRVHTFAPVEIAGAGGTAAAAGGSSLSLPWTIGGTAAILVALGLVVLAGRRARAAAAPAPASRYTPLRRAPVSRGRPLVSPEPGCPAAPLKVR